MNNSNRDKKRVIQRLQQNRLVIQPSALEHYLTKAYTTTENGLATGTYVPFDDTLTQFINKQRAASVTTITTSHVDAFFSALSSSSSSSTSQQQTSSTGTTSDLSAQQELRLRESFDVSSVNVQPPKFSQASSLIQAQLQRSKLIKDLCQNNNLLGSLRIIPINSLISSRGTHSLFGTITQKIHDKSIYLEDSTGIVRLNLDRCDKIGEGVFCAGMSVLVNGEWDQVNQSVVVSAMVLPPIATKDTMDFMQTLPNESSRVVVIKDLYLDQVGVLEKLYTLFHFLAERDVKPETLVLLMGSFVSPEFKSANPSNMSLYKGLFAELVPLVNHFSTLKIRFIPGNRDLCPGNFNGILPRAEISAQVRDLFSQMKHVKFCTDPCGGTWWNKVDVRVCADLELGSRLMRNNLFRVSNLEKEHTQKDDEWVRSWRTIIRQRHVAPFELTVQPVYWQLDSELSLVPFLNEGNKSENLKVIIAGDGKRDWWGRVEEVDGVLVLCAPSWYHKDQYLIWDANGVQIQTLLTSDQ